MKLRCQEITDIESLEDAFHHHGNNLSSLWEHLFSISDSSFFQSWAWVNSWFAVHVRNLCLCMKIRAFLIIITDLEDVICALGIFSLHKDYNRRLLPVWQMRLGDTGCERHDIITVEHNSLLIRRGYEGITWRVMIDYFMESISSPEMVIRSCAPYLYELLKHIFPGKICTISDTFHHVVDLDILRQQQCVNSSRGRDVYVGSLGRSTRGKIRRLLRELEADGSLMVEVAKSPFQAMNMLQDAMYHHRMRWGKAAFDHTEFKAFHETLIYNYYEEGNMHVMAVMFNRNPIGWLYFMIDSMGVRFYFGAFDYENRASWCPGLISHTMAIEYYMTQGYGKYDFLAGNERYKNNLSMQSSYMPSIVLQKNSGVLCVERAMKLCKRYIRDIACAGRV